MICHGFRFFPPVWIMIMLTLELSSCNNNTTENKTVTRPPNVVLILTDDQGYGDLSMHRNSWVETPFLDSMAQASTELANFYVCPLCAPTRASILTGRYHPRTGVVGVSGGLENMAPEEFTLAELFKSADYATGCFGKWHNGAYWPYHPNAQGFDEFVGFCSGHWSNYFNTELQHNGAPYPTEGYITDVLTNEAIRFIEQNKDKPFFCYVPYNVPHSPFQVPDQYFDKYYAKLSDVTDEETRRKRAAVYGMCENVDDNVRRISQTLDELGLTDNTIIIYLSDNGPNGYRYNTNLRGIKGSVHEGGVRVPFLIRWPTQVPAGQRSEAITAHIDLLPTLAGLCNISVPEDISLDGMDLTPLLTGHMEALPDRTIFFQQSGEALAPVKGGLRNEQYRLVLEEEESGLFDMRQDPSQLHNLADSLTAKYDSLGTVYTHWYGEMAASYQAQTVIPVGYPEFPRVVMPAHESHFSGNLRFKEGHGWAHDWLINWSGTGDTLWWDMEIVQPGAYQVALQYTCPASDVGSAVVISIGAQQLRATVTEAFNPAYLDSPDRVTRQEVYEKQWAVLTFGTLTLEKGNYRVKVHASDIPGSQVMELKGLIMQKAP